MIRLLNSLDTEKQYIKEIIIVEQVRNNKSSFLNEVEKLGLNAIYIFLQKASTSIAKNIGTNKADSEIVLFLDDDVIVEPGLIKNHLKNFVNPKVAAVCGRSITIGQKIELNRHDVGRISYLAQFSDGYSSDIKQEIDTVIGCNSSWRKSVFTELGGFDRRFTGNAIREESDLSLRAKKAGFTILFEPLALVKHLREETGGTRKSEGRISWYYHFFSNETFFFLKHFHKLYFIIFLATKMEWALRCMFGFGREISLRSLVTPALGIIDGIKKYKMFFYENRS